MAVWQCKVVEIDLLRGQCRAALREAAMRDAKDELFNKATARQCPLSGVFRLPPASPKVAPMSEQNPPALHIGYAKSRLAKNIVICLVFVGGGLFLSLRQQADANTQVMLAIATGFFALCLVALLPRFLARGPAVVITQAGIRQPTFADETVPWGAVQDLRRLKHAKTDTLTLTLDAATAATLTRRGLTQWLPKSWRGSGTSMSLPLMLLEGDPEMIVGQCAALVGAARHSAAARGQSLPAASDRAPQPAAVSNKARPSFTYALLAVLAFVYGCELVFGIVPGTAGAPGVETLAVLGGIIGERIWQDGEWWRLFTAPLLHADPMHLAFNAFALWLSGALLERLVGWRWFAAIFAASALGGSLASLAINAPDSVGVGASGGIVGLFAACIVASRHFPEGVVRTRMMIGALQVLIPSLLPILATGSGHHIDYAAHFGGAVAGGLVSALAVWAWPHARAEPRFGGVAGVFAGVCGLVAIGAVWPVMVLWGEV